jgi:ketosteroid isomerase-like protein
MPDARAIQERLREAANAQDVNAILRWYSSDAVVITPEGTLRGAEEISAYVDAQFEAFPDFHVAVHHRLDADDTALDEGIVSGTHTGPLTLPTGETIAPTGKRVTQRVADVLVARDGKIVEHRLYYDQVELLVQLELDAPILQPATG